MGRLHCRCQQLGSESTDEDICADRNQGRDTLQEHQIDLAFLIEVLQWEFVRHF